MPEGLHLADFSQSPHAVVRPVPLDAVTLDGGFWGEWERLARETAIPHGYTQLVETGSVEAFDIAAGASNAPLRGFVYRDSDVYKWLEATACSGSMKTEADRVIAKMAAAQQPDGYLNTSFSRENAEKRYSNLLKDHEIYCAGHLIQAAIAHHRATGSDALLGIAVRLAEHQYERFGPNGQVGTCGHPVIEMALTELYRLTKDERWLALAKRNLDARGADPRILGGGEYLLDHLPFREQRTAVGHAVRALYLYAGATDIYLETGERDLLQTCLEIWKDVYEKKVYVTGGLGARHEGEAFGEPYELPNARAYAETCAAVAAIQWNWRLFAATGEHKYLNAIETALYNGFLAGAGLDGKSYFYVNPLASDGGYSRKPWYDCACCPPNIYRTLAGIRGLAFCLVDDGVVCNLYAPCTLDHGDIGLQMRTNYPWDGAVEIEVLKPGRYAIYLRHPAWCESIRVAVNGEAAQPARIERDWQRGDRIAVEMDMFPERIYANPHVTENRSACAIRRGPLLYCIEQVDNDAPVGDFRIHSSATFQDWQPTGLSGMKGLAFDGSVTDAPDELYSKSKPYENGARTDVRAIPYFAWANRGAGAMRVWIPERTD